MKKVLPYKRVESWLVMLAMEYYGTSVYVWSKNQWEYFYSKVIKN